jgi:hypothetical protein
MEPIFIRRSIRTASGAPEFMSERCNVIVSECGDAMSHRSRMGLPRGLLRVLERLPRMLMSRQVILFSMLLGNPVGMRGKVV